MTTKAKTSAKAVAVRSEENENRIASVEWTPEQIQLIKNTVARGATDDELKLFLYTARRTGLDPLTKQIHFVKRKVWNKQKNDYDEVGSIQTGIDGYRVIAERTSQLAGIDDAQFEESNGMPLKATVTVYKLINNTRVPFTASARWKEYAQIYQGKVGGQWAKMPYLMLGKCAEALALRKGFPNDLSGIYTNEEMQQADNEIKDVKTIETPKPPQPTIKQRISFSISKLRPEANIENIYTIAKELTNLDLVEANYQEINDRLAILVEEAAQK